MLGAIIPAGRLGWAGAAAGCLGWGHGWAGWACARSLPTAKKKCVHLGRLRKLNAPSSRKSTAPPFRPQRKVRLGRLRKRTVPSPPPAEWASLRERTAPSLPAARRLRFGRPEYKTLLPLLPQAIYDEDSLQNTSPSFMPPACWSCNVLHDMAFTMLQPGRVLIFG